MDVLETVIGAYDERSLVELTCCDLTKAFDTVDHHILLNKLNYYGVRGTPLGLLASYLEGRQQRVYINNSLSATKTIDQGVPQGSILGPLLFIIYINDLLPNIVAQKSCLYADDVSFINTAKTEIEVEASKMRALEDTKVWCDANRLKVNEEKTQSLKFSSKNHQSTSVIKYLGMYVDNKLTWSKHISELSKKLPRDIYCIRRLKIIATHETAKATYYSNFYSKINYGILFWGMSSEAHRIFIMQKKL